MSTMRLILFAAFIEIFVVALGADVPSIPIQHTDANSSESNFANQEGSIVFGMAFNVVNPTTNEGQKIDITLGNGDDPLTVANNIREQFGISLLTYRWLLRSFQHSVARMNEEEVASLDVSVEGRGQMAPISIHYGDDLAQLSRVYCYNHGLDLDPTGNDIYQSLIDAIPQHSSMEWITRRRSHSQSPLSKSIQENGRNFHSHARERYAFSTECKLTVGIYTNGNPALFYNTVEKFVTTDLVCEVLVVDDSSSIAARTKMINDYPSFNFVFIPNQEQGGLARALNTMTRMSKSRFFLFLDSTFVSTSADDEHLRKAITILSTQHHVAQVVLNDQSSATCSLGLDDISRCAGSGGWKRILTLPPNNSIELVENEFGSMSHMESSQWSGFSYVPSVWDLNTLNEVAEIYFDETEDSDTSLTKYSLTVWDLGLTTVHLPSVMNYQKVA